MLAFDEGAPSYRDILSSLFKLMEEEEFPNSARTSIAMFDAAKSGNIMILEFILKCNPNLLLKVDSSAKLTSHCNFILTSICIPTRPPQKKSRSVYQLILSKGAYKNAIMQLVEHETMFFTWLKSRHAALLACSIFNYLTIILNLS